MPSLSPALPLVLAATIRVVAAIPSNTKVLLPFNVKPDGFFSARNAVSAG